MDRQPTMTDRRGFLRLAGLAGATLAGAGFVAGPQANAAAKKPFKLWSDPDTWNGAPPGPGDLVTLSDDVILDTDASVGGLIIEEGATLMFDSGKDVALESTKNVIVYGKLKMRPSAPRYRHTLTFVGVDEGAFVGDGLVPLDSDVGLWVVEMGELDVKGSKKLPWGRLEGSAQKGDRTITLDREPAGWRVGDELAITPTLKPTDPMFEVAYDVVNVLSVTGRDVKVAHPLDWSHPTVKLPSGKRLGAEVLNLTRNVEIGGTSSGRSHIFVHSMSRPTIQYMLARYVGPRKDDLVVLGRWGVHLHHMEDDSRGTEIVGVVVRDAGSHAFVAHHSHGVTFRRCIAHDVIEDAFWWDHMTNDDMDASNDITYERCVASKLEGGPVDEHNLTGFKMENGTGNAATGCIAVGIRGGSRTSGFHWPEPGPHGFWTFEDCLAHNNLRFGAFTWQNDDGPHIHRDFTAYRCGNAALGLGAYGNRVHVFGLTSVEHGDAGVHNFARTSTADDSALRYRDLVIDGGSVTPFGIRFIENNLPPKEPLEVIDAHFLNVQTPVYVNTTADGILVDLIRPVVGPEERNLEPSDVVIEFAAPGTLIRVQRKNDLSAWRIDATGTVADIPPFA